MNDELITRLESHSQIRRAEYLLTGLVGNSNALVDIQWADGRRTKLAIMDAVRWIEAHPPRCWSWTHSPARNTVRDYCRLTLDHEGAHEGDRGSWT
jgi:hypothetical protein